MAKNTGHRKAAVGDLTKKKWRSFWMKTAIVLVKQGTASLGSSVFVQM
jgi:hypothetical protein